MQKWEYLQAHTHGDRLPWFDTAGRTWDEDSMSFERKSEPLEVFFAMPRLMLEKLGSDGWELVAIMGMERGTAIFRRPKE